MLVRYFVFRQLQFSLQIRSYHHPVRELCASGCLALRAVALIVEPFPFLGTWLLIVQSIKLFSIRICASALAVALMALRMFQQFTQFIHDLKINREQTITHWIYPVLKEGCKPFPFAVLGAARHAAYWTHQHWIFGQDRSVIYRPPSKDTPDRPGPLCFSDECRLLVPIWLVVVHV